MNVLPAVSDGDAMAHVESVVRRSGSSFYWAMRVLPAAKRKAMFAVYAFCREVDDIADDPGDEDGKLQRLRGWREEIHRLFDGGATFPVTWALVGPVAEYGLRKEDFLAIIDGMEMDAVSEVSFSDMAELRLYCDRVACAVGRLSICVFGVEGEKGAKIASALGEALQVTNILRDIHEDAARGRLYLPRELLDRHGVSGRTPKDVAADPALPAVCGELAELASRRFAEAENVLAECDIRHVRPAVMMMEAYRRILERLCERGWQRIAGRVKLPKIVKLWIVVRYGIF